MYIPGYINLFVYKTQPYWLRGDGSESGDDPESGGEGAAAAAVKKYPVDPPPAYNQADLFTQQEVSVKKQLSSKTVLGKFRTHLCNGH